MLFSRQTKRQRGISLIEAVIYVSMFAFLGLIAMSSLFSTVKAFSSLRISRDINDSSVTIMERLTRDLKSTSAIDIAESTFGSNPGRLTLITVNASGTVATVEYFVTNGALHVRENSVDKGSLTSAKTKVDGLVFYYINTGATISVKTELHITSSRGPLSSTEHFYNTSLLRGSY
jgi:type II secretory pathway component PulJ